MQLWCAELYNKHFTVSNGLLTFKNGMDQFFNNNSRKSYAEQNMERSDRWRTRFSAFKRASFSTIKIGMVVYSRS